jgi:hypothetical protein
MRITRVLGVVAVLLAAACLAQADEKAKGKGKAKKQHGAGGVVTTVSKDSFSAKVGGKKANQKKGTPAVEPTEKTFKVADDTKFEKVEAAKKGEKPTTTAAALADLHEGDRVVIVADGDTAKEVKILPAKKKKDA